jgi:hypothetical protein
VCDQGSFFVGGVPKVTKYAAGPTAGDPQQITIGQAYVQFQVPKTRRQWPIIFVHGSTHTGAALDSTPDGREGWHSYAVRHNLASFVMDQPGRGRSGFDQSVLHEAKATSNWDMVPTFGRITDNGAWTAWFGHITGGTTIMAGKMIRHGDPGDPDPAENTQPSPAHGNYPPKFPIPPGADSADPKLVARNGAIGPAPNAANNEYLGLEYYKQTFRNSVMRPRRLLDAGEDHALVSGARLLIRPNVIQILRIRVAARILEPPPRRPRTAPRPVGRGSRHIRRAPGGLI